MRWLRLWTLIVDVFHHVIIVHCDLWPQSYIKLWVISIWGVSIASSHSTKTLTCWFSSCLKTSSRILLLLKGDLISDLNCISEMGQGKKKSVMKLIFGAAALFFFLCVVAETKNVTGWEFIDGCGPLTMQMSQDKVENDPDRQDHSPPHTDIITKFLKQFYLLFQLVKRKYLSFIEPIYICWMSHIVRWTLFNKVHIGFCGFLRLGSGGKVNNAIGKHRKLVIKNEVKSVIYQPDIWPFYSLNYRRVFSTEFILNFAKNDR